MNRTIGRNESGASARSAWPIAVSSNLPSARWLNTDLPASMRIKRKTESGSRADLGGHLLSGLRAVGQLVGDAQLCGHVERLASPMRPATVSSSATLPGTIARVTFCSAVRAELTMRTTRAGGTFADFSGTDATLPIQFRLLG